tara:strand:- start:597 stop:1343 length:747 start_codon:yes stop_codon:yes gene_type:complete
MSGGKGGSKTTETTIPDWIKDPAIRNLQRAEDVQRLEYMPYYGADVAAFNPMQNAAMDNNLNTAKAFGLLDPNSTLSATTGMPTPTTYANGMKGYSSQPLYEEALAELKANQPDAVAQYDALFGANVPTTRSTGQGGFRGSANAGSPPPLLKGFQEPPSFTPNYDTSTWSQKQQDSHNAQINPNSTINTLDASYALDKNGLIGGNKGSGTDYKSIVAGMKAQDSYEQAAGIGRYANTPNKIGYDRVGK